jgi:hypothetical protein
MINERISETQSYERSCLHWQVILSSSYSTNVGVYPTRGHGVMCQFNERMGISKMQHGEQFVITYSLKKGIQRFGE